MKRKGFLITFEGIDGSGKTTQLRLTEKYLRDKGYDILVLREPGSTPLGEKIRKILLHRPVRRPGLDRQNKINPASELLLYVAARAELVKDVIEPSLKRGTIILCDRFYDSTTAYQGYGRGIDINLLENLNRVAVGESIPDLTFLVDLDYRTSLGRRKKFTDRLESESKAFFNRVRRGFLEIARKEPQRIAMLDGRKGEEELFISVKSRICQEVASCLRTLLKIK